MWRLRQGGLDLPEWPLHRAAFSLQTNDLRRPERRGLLRDHLQRVWGKHRLRDDLPKEWLVLRGRFVQGRAVLPATHLQPNRRPILWSHWRRMRRNNRLRPAVLRWLNLRRAGPWCVRIIVRHSRPTASPASPAAGDSFVLWAAAADPLPATATTAVASVVLPGFGRGRVAQGGRPPQAPTDPDVPNSGIRLFRITDLLRDRWNG